MCSFHFSDSTIDYIAQYRLVDRSRLEMYGRAFTLEDEDEDGIISYEVLKSFYTRQEKRAKVTLLKLISWKGFELVLTFRSCLVVVQSMELLKTR